MISIYWGKSFTGFFITFFSRIWSLLQGKVSMEIDELQIVTLGLISSMAALIGLFLVVRKMTMVANAISHTVLTGVMLVVIISYYLTGTKIAIMEGGMQSWALLGASLVTSFLTMGLIELLKKKFHLQKDVSIGLVFSFLFAVGIVLATIFTRNSHIGTDVVMGNIDLVVFADLLPIFILTLSVCATVILLWRPLVYSSFDGQFSSIAGISENLFNYLMILLTSLMVIVAMRIVGVVLVLSLLIVPVLTSRLLFSSLRKIAIASFAINFTASVISVALARHFLSVYGVALSTSGLIVALLSFFWLFVTLFSSKRGIVFRYLREKRA